MRLMQETTHFHDATAPNHSYLFSKTGVAIGMQKFSQGPVVLFRTPLAIDTRGRTFRLVDDLGPDAPAADTTVQVVGSKGDVYTVDLETHRCTCPRFKYYGDCKHIAAAIKESAN
jgi:hypothetical protein